MAIATLAAAGCGSIVDPSQNQTETLSGTLTTGNASAQAFNVSKGGEYSITLLSVTPTLPAGVLFQVFLGQNTTQGCAPITANLVQVGQVALSSSIVPSAYCAGISDINRVVPTSVIYSLQVRHP